MQIPDGKLRKLLVEPGHLSDEDFKLALTEAKEKKINLEDILVQKGLIRDEQLGKTIAEGLDLKFIDLRKIKVDDDVLNLIPELVARSREVVAFARDEEGVKIGMTNPEDVELRHLVQKCVGENIVVHYITQSSLESALLVYKDSIKDMFDATMQHLQDASLTREERDETAIKVVDMLMQYGYDNKASDIHIEPYEEKILARFRIDGVMHDVLDMPKDLSDIILTRIKIMAKMRTDEHRAAQDGKFQFTTKDENVDTRVSIVPVTKGEKIVMRLLSAKARQFDLVSLGLAGNDLEKVRRATENPHGMLLVTGPTGSGKTTTVYAVMKILNKREVNISTIEDPVEYDIEGISQIQVNAKTNLTFAKGLRAIVRQDPDIIMVGEIRDEETAGIAVNSATTGHLVLSTLHASDAATTLPRLLDMGIEPFLVASTVNVIIAQRLVRKICERCRVSYLLTDEEKKIIEGDPELKAVFEAKGYKDPSSVRLYKGAGCKVCGDTGYAGRIGVFEVLEMTEKVKDLIIKRPSSGEITASARQNGMTTMLEDGANKVFEGITTLDEVFRVTKM